jgi:hypothetical protein
LIRVDFPNFLVLALGTSLSNFGVDMRRRSSISSLSQPRQRKYRLIDRAYPIVGRTVQVLFTLQQVRSGPSSTFRAHASHFVREPRVRRRQWPGELWRPYCRRPPPDGRLCRPRSQGREARRAAGPAGHTKVQKRIAADHKPARSQLQQSVATVWCAIVCAPRDFDPAYHTLLFGISRSV